MVSFNYRLIYDDQSPPVRAAGGRGRGVIIYREETKIPYLARSYLSGVSRSLSLSFAANYQRRQDWLLCLQLEIFPNDAPVKKEKKEEVLYTPDALKSE